MGARPKGAKKVRTADEFSIQTARNALGPPIDSSAVFSWSLADIMAARDAQMRGQFRLASKLAASMRTDDAIFVARSNRLAPQRCLRVEIVPAKGARGASIGREAEGQFGHDGIACAPGTLSDINGCLADHGVAFATMQMIPREDGSRVDLQISFWPIEHVWKDETERCFKTRIDTQGDMRFGSSEETIVHGDGRWLVFALHDHKPYAQDAAVVPGSLVWARHAYALRDWTKASVAHGSAKVIGKLGAGVAIQEGSALTKEAQSMIELLRAIASSDAPVGLAPAGSEIEFLTNNSTAWQVWTELASNAEKAAARIYLGTDGTLGAQGGAPGVDISALFGVAATKVQGDLSAISRGMQTAIEIWTAVNFGDSTLAPTRRYMTPDPDTEADRDAMVTRRNAFYADWKQAKELGAFIDQDFLDELAETHGVDAPQLPETAPPLSTPGLQLVPTASDAAAE